MYLHLHFSDTLQLDIVIQVLRYWLIPHKIFFIQLSSKIKPTFSTISAICTKVFTLFFINYYIQQSRDLFRYYIPKNYKKMNKEEWQTCHVNIFFTDALFCSALAK